MQKTPSLPQSRQPRWHGESQERSGHPPCHGLAKCLPCWSYLAGIFFNSAILA